MQSVQTLPKHMIIVHYKLQAINNDFATALYRLTVQVRGTKHAFRRLIAYCSWMFYPYTPTANLLYLTAKELRTLLCMVSRLLRERLVELEERRMAFTWGCWSGAEISDGDMERAPELVVDDGTGVMSAPIVKHNKHKNGYLQLQKQNSN